MEFGSRDEQRVSTYRRLSLRKVPINMCVCRHVCIFSKLEIWPQQLRMFTALSEDQEFGLHLQHNPHQEAHKGPKLQLRRAGAQHPLLTCSHIKRSTSFTPEAEEGMIANSSLSCDIKPCPQKTMNKQTNFRVQSRQHICFLKSKLQTLAKT